MSIRALMNMMTAVSILILAGFFVREFVKPLQKLFLPASLVGGLVMLGLGQQGLGLITVPKVLGSVPGVLIDIVMVSLVFGVSFNRKMLHSYLDYVCLPMPAYGMQMCVGTLLGGLLSQFWPGLPLGWGVLGVFSFHGGHGTAAAAAASFEKQGLEGHMAVAMVLSTVGLIVAMTVGMALVNCGVRRGWGTFVKEPTKQPDYFYGGALPEEQRKSIGSTVTTSISINHLCLQFAWLMGALFIGQQIFGFLNTFPAFKALHLPSVLHGVVGGAVMWAIIERLHLEKFVDLKTIKLLSGFFLELVVFTAMAKLNLKFVSTYAAPLAIYSIVLTTLTVPLVLFCARKFAREEWFEKACMCFGAATGNTSTGLALVRSIDPNSESHAGDSHGIYSTISAWKDIFVGLTPLWLMSGLGFTAGVGAVVMVAFLAIGFIFFNTHRKLTR